jgi:putative efflux protein, MATE family
MHHANGESKPTMTKDLADDVNMPKRERTPEDWVDDRAFKRTLFKLALPIVLQSIINAAVNSADVLMLAYVNQSALSATSLAGQISFVLTLFYMGISTGVMILGAQYWGIRDIEAIEKIQGYALRKAGVISLLFFFGTWCFPAALMRLFTPDQELISLGADYLKVVGFSYLFMGTSQIFLATLKSVEQTKVSAIISSVCLVINVIFNALAIFVFFPNEPHMAIMGVAGATVIARGTELLLCLLLNINGKVVKLRIRHLIHTEAWLRKSYRQCAVPVQLNFLIWGGALTATSALMGHISAEMVAASSIAVSIRNLATVACSGLSNGGSILLGKHLGAQRIALAKRDGDKLRKWSLLLGVMAGLVVLLVRPICLNMNSVSGETHQLLDGMLFICAYYCIGKSYNSTLVGGIFAAGGDTKFGLYCDTAVMWGIVIPLGCLVAFYFEAPPLIIFFVLCLDEFIKMPIVAWRYRKYLWLNNLTKKRKEV